MASLQYSALNKKPTFGLPATGRNSANPMQARTDAPTTTPWKSSYNPDFSIKSADYSWLQDLKSKTQVQQESAQKAAQAAAKKQAEEDAAFEQYLKSNNPYAGGVGGMSASQYYNDLLGSSQASIQGQFNANMATIQQNLTVALANLENEKAALQPKYMDQLNSIQSEEYNTGEAQKELMNQAGWNAANSGVAVGEYGKIAGAANKARDNAKQNLVNNEAIIERESTTQKNLTASQQSALEQWKTDQSAAARADAKLKSDTYASEQSQRAASLKQQAAQWTQSQRDTKAKKSAEQATANQDSMVQGIVATALAAFAKAGDTNAAYQQFMADPAWDAKTRKAISEAYTIYGKNLRDED